MQSSTPNQNSNESARLKSEKLLSIIDDKAKGLFKSSEISLGDAVLFVESRMLKDLLIRLHSDDSLKFNSLISLTAVDWLDSRSDRFEVVYHLLSIPSLDRLRIKVSLSEDNAKLPTATDIWKSANWLEREVFDMFGIKFDGHPDLRRILMYEEFKGHPLRKDYPVQGKQPRVPLRYPEVENTARQMHRPDLVQIRSKQTESGLKKAI